MKTNIAIHIFLILSFSYAVTAQDCLSTGITFTTQKQIDNFSTNYPSCTKIKGNVLIKERKANNINNLNGLSQITSVAGNLKVSGNTKLTSLKGLNYLNSIGGQFGIWGNSSLENITDLEDLNSINGHLTISNNHSLKNLEGLNKLISVGGFFRVKENDSMTSLNGLGNLFSIGQDLWVVNNGNLKNVNGLENLTSIKGNIMVTENKVLEEIDGLKNLTFIGKSLKVMNNDSLKSLSVLNNVTTIGGRIKIDNNASLLYQNELDKLSPTSEKEMEKIVEKKNVKIIRKVKKWEFGVQAGTASVKLKKSERGKLFDSRSEEIKYSSKGGFRVLANAKYNIDNRIHFIGGLGILKAKGVATKTTSESSGGFFSPTVRTTIIENVNQNYTFLEVPVYLRMYLFGDHKTISDNFNIFLDFGASYKKPLNIESSYTRGESISTTTTGFSLFGSSSSSTTTSTPSYDSGELKLQSELSEYFAFGFLIGDRISMAFISTGINTQAVNNRSLKYKSRLNSVAVEVFF